MTVIICEQVGDQVYLLSDCLLTTLNTTDPHVQTPLGLYLDEIFPPEQYRRTFTDIQQKSARYGNKMAIAIAGTYWLGRRLLIHIAEQFEKISSLDSLIQVVKLKDGLQETDIIICGFIIEGGRPRLFKYELGSGDLLADVPKIVVGSGQDLGEKYSDWRQRAEDKMNMAACYLYGDEIFSAEAAYRAIGGVYLGFVYDGKVIRRPRKVTFFFWLATVSGSGEITGRHEPFWLSLIYVGDIAVVRSMVRGEEPSATSQLEMRSIGPIFLMPIVMDTIPDHIFLVQEASQNFFADHYFANFNINIANEGIYTFSTMWKASGPNCPFQFSGTYQDHYFKISETLYSHVVEHSLKAFRSRHETAGKPNLFSQALPESAEANALIASIETNANSMLEEATANFQGGQWPTDFLIMAALRRTISLKDAFLLMIREQNYSVAASLLCLQLDTGIRFSAILHAPQGQRFANEVLHGKEIHKQRSRSGKRLTTKFLIAELSEIFPWLKPLYASTFRYLHFSKAHVLDGMKNLDPEDTEFEFTVSAKSPLVRLEEWIELLRNYEKALLMTSNLVLAMANARPKSPRSGTRRTPQQ